MSTEGEISPTPWQDGAVPGKGSGDSGHQATLTKLKTLAYHPKEFSHVTDDHHADESVLATKILHAGQDDKSTITLTAYEKEQSAEKSVLKLQLEDYFQVLRTEFEARTGREWQPLKAWPAEEWEWAWDNEEA